MFTHPENFRLLAIRLRENCDERYSKNLEKGQIYSFYNNYKFIQNENGLITSIEETSKDFALYNDFLGETPQFKINVSAIVGKNGSGKSTLVELFFLTCYLVAIQKKFISTAGKSRARLLEQQELDLISKGLKLEVYYEISSQLYCIVIDHNFNEALHLNGQIQYCDLIGGTNLKLLVFFYTVAVNYSLHGLNDVNSGQYISRLFHKNDGYQTPVVINPFRNKGTIEVGGELHFAQTRLLSNLLLNTANDGEIVPDKRVTAIKFLINREKFRKYEGYEMTKVIRELEKTNNLTLTEIFDRVYLAFINIEPNHSSLKEKTWRNYTVRYVIRKMIRIAQNYPEYKKFYSPSLEGNIPGLKNIEKYIEKLKKDRSHITLKLRQALNFYRYDPLRADMEGVTIEPGYVYIKNDLFVARLKDFAAKNADNDPAEFVPAAPFTPRFILDDKIEFHTLSSGEQQYIHSIQAISYHILNLNSVFNSNHTSSTTYQFINIMLDEIELYFHPEFQRRFIKDLLDYIGHLQVPNIKGINILLLTHSPFILSDIPATNVLRLKNGKVDNDQPLTFAGNIHQMLSSSFFMDATTGEVARHHYNEIISFYQSARSAENFKKDDFKNTYAGRRDKFRFIVSQIGEDVIREVLKNHLTFLDEKYGFDGPTSPQIKALEEQKAAIQKQIDDLNATNKLP